MLLSVPRIVCRVFVNMRFLLFGLIGGNYWSRWISISLTVKRPFTFGAYRYALVDGVHVKAYLQCIISIHSHVLMYDSSQLFIHIYSRHWLCCVRVCIVCFRGSRRRSTSPCELQWNLVHERRETWLRAILWSCVLRAETSSSLECHAEKVQQQTNKYLFAESQNLDFF